MQNKTLSVVVIVALVLSVGISAALVSVDNNVDAKKKIGFHGCEPTSKAFNASKGKCFHTENHGNANHDKVKVKDNDTVAT